MSRHEKPLLVIHAGTHKTGTTAIQRFASANREALRHQGCIYPTYSPVKRGENESHLALFHSIAGEPSPLRRRKLPALVSAWEREISGDSDMVLLSAEAVWRHIDRSVEGGWRNRRRAFLFRIAELFQDFHVRPVVVIRSQEELARSSYRESVRRGLPAGRARFDEFVKKRSTTTLRYADNIKLFQQVFSAVDVLLYDDIRSDGDIVSGFFGALGFHDSDSRGIGQVRPSLSVAETLVKRFLNEYISASNDWKLALLRDPEMQALLDRYYCGCEDFWSSEAERRAFLESWGKDNEFIRMHWYPERRSLFDERDPGVPASYTIPEEIVDLVNRRKGSFLNLKRA